MDELLHKVVLIEKRTRRSLIPETSMDHLLNQPTIKKKRLSTSQKRRLRLHEMAEMTKGKLQPQDPEM